MHTVRIDGQTLKIKNSDNKKLYVVMQKSYRLNQRRLVFSKKMPRWVKLGICCTQICTSGVLTSGFCCVIIISRTLVRVISKPKETDYETEE